MAAKSTYQTYLMYKATSGASYTKLVDIKTFPDLGGQPEMLDCTSLSDSIVHHVDGVQQLDSMDFTCNYEATDLTTLKGMKGTEYEFAVWFGADSSGDPDGHDGKFSFKGTLSAFAAGKGVNEVRETTISIANSTDITFAAS